MTQVIATGMQLKRTGFKMTCNDLAAHTQVVMICEAHTCMSWPCPGFDVCTREGMGVHHSVMTSSGLAQLLLGMSAAEEPHRKSSQMCVRRWVRRDLPQELQWAHLGATLSTSRLASDTPSPVPALTARDSASNAASSLPTTCRAAAFQHANKQAAHAAAADDLARVARHLLPGRNKEGSCHMPVL